MNRRLAAIDDRLSRRGFHRCASAAACGLLSAGYVAPLLAAGQGPAAAGPYVDVHTHLGRVWNRGEPLTADALLRWMDAGQIEQAVVLPLVSPESSSFPITTEYVLDATRPHRDRLIPFCAVDPRTSFSGGHAALVRILADYKAAGARGFGEHKPGVPIDDSRNMALYAACAEVELPVLFHLDNQRNTDAPGLPGLESVLKQHPDCNFIGHGPGWWASISGNVTQADLGGYPRGAVAPGGAIDRLMDRYGNLHGDLSAGSGAGAITRDPDFGRRFLIRRADRLLFGTDFLAPGQDVPQLELFASIDLPRGVADRVFLENARRLLTAG